MPLANDPIMSGRVIQSLRNLEHQNLSIISNSIAEPGWCNHSRGGGGGADQKIRTEQRSIVVLERCD